MSYSDKSLPPFCWAFGFLIIFGTYTNGHTYSVGDIISVKVNSLTSVKTQLPLSYYSLPYCKPIEGVKESAMNLGQLLIGDQIQNSPYQFHMNVNETVFLCAKGPLTADKAKLLKQRTRDLYQVNMILDNLPFGFPIANAEGPIHIDEDDYINNHLKFTVLIHELEGIGFEIVGFEVVPCSVKHSPELEMYENVEHINCLHELENSQLIQENETVSFTYEVEFVKSDIIYADRWDPFLEKGVIEFRWLSILNSIETIFILAGIVFVIYRRTIRRELTRNKELDEELLGWKLIISDVFREPSFAKLLCVLVGEGIQITGMALSTAVIASLGFISPASRVTFIVTMIVLYFPFSIAAGYSAVRLWRTIKGSSQGWKSVSCSVASFFLGIVSTILMFLNLLLWYNKSELTIPVFSFLILISLWFSISVPLTLVGGFLGTKSDSIQYPVETNQVLREIPSRKSSWLLFLGAAFFPFSILLNELRFILSSIWLGRFYSSYNFSLIVLVLILFACAFVSVILTYMRLRVEDWRWWWKAFFASGSTGICMFFYSICYLVFDLDGLSGSFSITLYMGYSLIMAIAVMLATGTVGFLVSFYFVHCLYSF